MLTLSTLLPPPPRRLDLRLLFCRLCRRRPQMMTVLAAGSSLGLEPPSRDLIKAMCAQVGQGAGVCVCVCAVPCVRVRVCATECRARDPKGAC